MNTKLGLSVLFILFIGAFSNAYSQKQTFSPDDIIGIWVNSDGGVKVKIEKVGTHYYGKLFWLAKPNEPDGTPKLDKHNPDPSLRQTPFIGLRVMRDIVYKGNNTWGDGSIYDPEKGKTFGCKITLNSIDQASIRGYLGLVLLGKSETFTRVKN